MPGEDMSETTDTNQPIFDDYELTTPPHDLGRDGFCSIWGKNPKLFIDLSNMLACRASARQVCAEARKHGIVMKEGVVRNHYLNHLLPAIGKIRVQKQAFNRLKLLNQGIAPDDAAQEIQMLIIQKLLPWLLDLQQKDLSGIPTKELLGIVCRVSDSLSNSQLRAAIIDLNAAKLQIARFNAAKTGQEAKRLGMEVIRELLKGRPDVLAQLNSVIQPVEVVNDRTDRPAISARNL